MKAEHEGEEEDNGGRVKRERCRFKAECGCDAVPEKQTLNVSRWWRWSQRLSRYEVASYGRRGAGGEEVEEERGGRWEVGGGRWLGGRRHHLDH